MLLRPCAFTSFNLYFDASNPYIFTPLALAAGKINNVIGIGIFVSMLIVDLIFYGIFRALLSYPTKRITKIILAIILLAIISGIGFVFTNIMIAIALG